jgi:hypothetical protein
LIVIIFGLCLWGDKNLNKMNSFEDYINRRGYSWNDFDRTWEMEHLIEQYAEEKVKLALDTIKPSKMPCGNCDVEQSVMYCEKCWDIANNN